ncbi:hypothetical protein [Microbulbifer sp. TRSA002]|uniref:hypothetical protein n=1 Tax=Microbulbifer sp. TRSA002 TaxID=3243382 RepID=UPI0040399358
MAIAAVAHGCSFISLDAKKMSVKTISPYPSKWTTKISQRTAPSSERNALKASGIAMAAEYSVINGPKYPATKPIVIPAIMFFIESFIGLANYTLCGAVKENTWLVAEKSCG